jgi:hypothetical protein
LKTGERVVVKVLMNIGPGAPVKAVPLGEAPPTGASPSGPPTQG